MWRSRNGSSELTLAAGGRDAALRSGPVPTRAVRRPPLYAWVLVGLVALALIYGLTPSRLHGHGLILTPLIVLAGVLAVRRLWELPPAPTLCGAVALTVFSGSWVRMGLGGLPLDRLLVIIVLLAVFLRAPGVAHVPRLQLKNVHLLMGLTILYALASAAAAGTLKGEVSLLSLIDEVGVTPYLMFLVAPAVFAGQRERNMLLATLVGLGAYLGCTAIFESLGPHSLVFPNYIVNADAGLNGRAGGPFQSTPPEGFATFVCAVAAVMAFAQWRGQRRRYFAAMVAAVCILGCFLTLERGVWIGVVAATVITALATRRGRRWLVPGTLACVLMVGGLLVISPTLASKATARVNAKESVWARQNQTYAALRMIQAKPLFGFGWYSFTSDSLEYFRQTSDYPMVGYVNSSAKHLLPLHDAYLAYAVELGLVGTLLWLASLFWGIGGAIFSRGSPDLRPWKLGLIAIFVCFLVLGFVDPYEAPFVYLILWVWAGVALGGSSLEAQQRRAKMAAPTSPPSGVVWNPI